MKEFSEEALYEAFARVYGCNRRFEGGYMAEYTQVRFNAFKFGAEWRDSEHAAALAKAEERCRELEDVLKGLVNESTNPTDDGSSFDACVSAARAALEGK